MFSFRSEMSRLQNSRACPFPGILFAVPNSCKISLTSDFVRLQRRARTARHAAELVIGSRWSPWDGNGRAGRASSADDKKRRHRAVRLAHSSLICAKRSQIHVYACVVVVFFSVRCRIGPISSRSLPNFV